MDDAAHHRGMAEQVFRQELQKIVEGERVERRKDIEELNSELNSKFKADFKNKNVLSLQNRLLTLTEHIVHLNDVTERYETVARTIQGLNDVIFDVDREARNPHDIILSEVEKDMLKRHGLGYLTQLLQPPKNLPAEIEGLRLRALSILTPQQLKLCQVLAEQDSDGQRNFLQHPRPDCRTVMDQVGVFLDADTRDTLHKFLETNPKRLPTRRERTKVVNPDLFLFEQEGKYRNVTVQKEDLEDLRAEKADTEAYLEALEQEA